MSDTRAGCSGRDPSRDDWPSVSVVVPVRNEAQHLEHAVASILDQDYPVTFDVCLAVAPSIDGTEQLADRIAGAEPRVSVVANRAGVTPSGLNAAIRATVGEVVVRVDGHAELSPGYIRRAVETMCRTGAVNVGGRQVPTPTTPFEEAVAAATTSRLGTGGATYRVGGREGPVDTVYLGVFDRAAGDAVGWFDESLIRNQDYELNIRLRRAGGTIWFDPELAVGYRPRSTWIDLARQYFEYGYWKAEVTRRHPSSLRARQVIPPMAVVLTALATLRAVRRPIWWMVPALGAAVLAAEAVRLRRRHTARAIDVVAVLATIPVAWSFGLFVGGAGAFGRRFAAAVGFGRRGTVRR
ncbi:MAG: glycosyltransferase family 2 protein [Ilumatobacteraceae bacterium]